jgi:hypothetical protein
MTRLAQITGGLDPTERPIDALAPLLADGVAGTAGGAPVVFWAKCGTRLSARRRATKPTVSRFLSPPTVLRASAVSAAHGERRLALDHAVGLNQARYRRSTHGGSRPSDSRHSRAWPPCRVPCGAAWLRDQSSGHAWRWFASGRGSCARRCARRPRRPLFLRVAEHPFATPIAAARHRHHRCRPAMHGIKMHDPRKPTFAATC